MVRIARITNIVVTETAGTINATFDIELTLPEVPIYKLTHGVWRVKWKVAMPIKSGLLNWSKLIITCLLEDNFFLRNQ